jgi:MFS family permease
MNATTQQIGYLSSIPNLAMAATQPLAPVMSEKLGARKLFIVLFSYLHAISFLPILLIPYIFRTDMVWWLITFQTLGTAFDSLTNPVWGSMMADLVRTELRGRYFGGRNRITGLVNMLLSFAAGGILQALTGDARLAFTLIFIGAAMSRAASAFFISRMHEPDNPAVATGNRPGVFRLLTTLGSTNVGWFILLNGFVNFAAALAGPFFSPYMLRELKFNYITYTIINAAQAVTTLAFMTYWGKRADRAGTVRIMKLTAYLVPFVPLLWLVSRNLYWVIVVQVFSGLAWAGFQLAGSIFIFDASPQDNRARHIALFNLLTYVGAGLGSMAGGIIAPLLPEIMASYFLSIFAVSGAARMIVVLIFMRGIKEVRDVSRVSTRQLLIGDIRLPGIKETYRRISENLLRIFRG